MTQDHLQPHPKPSSPERPLPSEIWPDLAGVLKAKVVTWEPTLANWKKFWKQAARFPIVSVDTETSGLRPFHGSRIVGVAAAYYDGKEIQAGYWNFRHEGHAAHKWCQKHEETKKGCEACAKGKCPGYKEKAPVIPVEEMALIAPVFRDVIIAGQNFKYDCKMFFVDGIEVPARVMDTMLIAHLWDENKRRYNLEVLAEEMGEQKLGDTIKAYMEEHGLPITKGHAQVPHEVESPYAVRDTVLVLKRLQWERDRWKAAGDHRLMDIFQVENGCTPAFARMEINGLKLDLKYVAEGIKQLEEELAGIQKDLWGLAKREFDIMSTQQLWEVLEARGLKPVGQTPGGAPALGATELEHYSGEGDPVAKLVLGYRSRYKILNTYLKPFRDEHADPKGFLHADFFIAGTVSGRTSCREPNLQNMSRPEAFTASNTMRGATAKMIQQGTSQFENWGEEKVQVRRCFIPRSKDHSLFFFDYSQMELRIFADYAEEPFMLKALETEGSDIHESVAREVFPNFPDKEKNPLLYKFFRQLTKQINFGIIYGMGQGKLAVQLSVPVDEATRLLKMVQKVAEEDPDLAKKCCTLTAEEVEGKLEDLRIMRVTRQWQGLRATQRDVLNRINPDPLAEYLFADHGNMGLMYSAESFLNRYHARFNKIKPFIKGIEKIIAARGYIFNRYGRRYHMRTEEAYVGNNRLVQGTTADQVKVADWRVDRLLQGTKSFMINNVHDELQVDLHHDDLHLVPKIKEAMEFYPNIAVKMLVEADYAHTSWAEKRKWKGPEEFLASLKEARADGRDTGAEAGRKGGKKPAARKPVRKAAVARR